MPDPAAPDHEIPDKYDGWTIDPLKTAIVVYSYPDGMYHGELSDWLFWYFRLPHFLPEPHVEPLKKIMRQNAADLPRARNLAIDYALHRVPDQFEWMLFCDNDVIPDKTTVEMFRLNTDVKCCGIAERGMHTWTRPDSFHDALWCIRRHDLLKLPPPWREPDERNEDGTQIINCGCTSTRAKMLAAGLTIGHAGFAKHTPGSSEK